MTSDSGILFISFSLSTETRPDTGMSSPFGDEAGASLVTVASRVADVTSEAEGATAAVAVVPPLGRVTVAGLVTEAVAGAALSEEARVPPPSRAPRHPRDVEAAVGALRLRTAGTCPEAVAKEAATRRAPSVQEEAA